MMQQKSWSSYFGLQGFSGLQKMLDVLRASSLIEYVYKLINIRMKMFSDYKIFSDDFLVCYAGCDYDYEMIFYQKNMYIMELRNIRFR